MMNPMRFARERYTNKIEQDVSAIKEGHWGSRADGGYNTYRCASRLESTRSIDDELALYEKQVIVNIGSGYIALRETMSTHDGDILSEVTKCGHYDDFPLRSLRKAAAAVREVREQTPFKPI